MTIEEAVNIWMPVVEMGVKDMPEIKEAVRMSIASLEAWEEVRADINNQLYVDSLIFGELMDFREGKISADDVIEEFNRVIKLEIMAIIDKHLQEVEHDI